MPRRKRRKNGVSSFNLRVRWLFVFLIILGLASVILVLYNPFIEEIDLHTLLQANLRASKIIDRNGEEIVTLSPSRVIWVPLEKIPLFLRRAVGK